MPALRDASPRDRHLRVLDPVTYTPLPHGPRVRGGWGMGCR